MKKVRPLALAALMIPSVALAKGPNPHQGTHSNQRGKARVMYVLKGTLSNYTAYTPASGADPAVDGQVTIDVKHANRHGKLLVGQSITIDVGQHTKIRLRHGVAEIAASGDRGVVRVRASRLAFKSAVLADVQAALQDQPAHMVAVWGPPSSS